MKTKLASFIAIITAIFVIGCGKSDNKTTTDNKNENSNKTEQKSDSKSTEVLATDKSVEIQCSGMTCTGCENTIKSKVKKVDGVKQVNADFNTNVVKASFDPAKTNTDAIKEAITAAGYKVESVK
ncbi:MAG: cation transporter [Ignavibacteria bacterium]